MSNVMIDQQVHGYKGGHHLLASSVRLSRDDQDLIDRLSDLSGPLDPGQVFDPYLTTYPLPSGDYYVVARTWQDRQAQRAGCVLTRSLIFPMTAWLGAPAMGAALSALTPFQKEGAKAEQVELSGDSDNLPIISGAWVEEVTEALFLEARQPIVVFAASDVDAVIGRLLVSLWPGLRKHFATCGFALGPRRLGGRLFDFLCAPLTSRARFSDWTGRKIEAELGNPARHRWTTGMATQIFRAPNPSLGTFDTLGLLRSDTKGSDSVLRVALLWNELAEKVETSPTAALGLLDILRSQDEAIGFELVEPALKKSVALSEQQSDVFEHLRFLLTMLGKFGNQTVPLSLLRMVYESAYRAAASSIKDSFAFLSSTDGLGRVIPRLLCGALAAASARSPREVLPQFVLLLPQTRLRLLASNREFGTELAKLNVEGVPGSVDAIKSAFESQDDRMRARAAADVLPALSRPDQAPILSGYLSSVEGSDIARAVELLWQGCQLSVSAFDQPILNAAARTGSTVQLRALVAHFPETANTDRLLLRTLEGVVEDISWVINAGEFSDRRRFGFLVKLLAASADSELVRICKSPGMRGRVLNLFFRQTSGAEQLARIFAIGGILDEAEFSRALELLPQLSQPELQHRLALAGLQSILFAEFGRDWDVEQAARALAECSKFLSAADVIVGFTDNNLEAADLNRNIQVLSASPVGLREHILRSIDTLCERIIAFRHSLFDQATTEAWANLIVAAGPIASRAQERAADLVLPFAMKMKFGPATSLLLATFPIVHAHLARGYIAPNIFTVFFFGDWDRCDTLRRELVDAFESSEWPPADLMVVAAATDELQAISQLVFRRLDKKYRKAILKDAERLPDALHDDIRRVFARLARDKY